MNTSKLKILNRDIIKYAAMFTMLLNHTATVFLKPGTVLYEVLENIGYFTAITMCYFLVEGYYYTHSKKKYAQRLLVFAFIAEVPYCLALGFYQLNMLFTLFFCFLIVYAMDKIENKAMKVAAVIGLILITVFCDWALFAAIFTVMFVAAKGSKLKIAGTYLTGFVLFAGLNTLSYATALTDVRTAEYSLDEAVMHGLLSGTGILVSGIVILFLYNGKKAKYGRVFSKWFFYIFYPAHLTVLLLIKLLLA